MEAIYLETPPAFEFAVGETVICSQRNAKAIVLANFGRDKSIIAIHDNPTMTPALLTIANKHLIKVDGGMPTPSMYEEAVYRLWKMLDDIDTASDMFKENYEGLSKYVYSIQQGRHDVITPQEVERLYEKFYKDEQKTAQRPRVWVERSGSTSSGHSTTKISYD